MAALSLFADFHSASCGHPSRTQSPGGCSRSLASQGRSSASASTSAGGKKHTHWFHVQTMSLFPEVSRLGATASELGSDGGKLRYGVFINPQIAGGSHAVFQVILVSFKSELPFLCQ